MLSLNAAWNANGMWALCGLAALLAPGAVVVMIQARRSPGRLVAHPFLATPQVVHFQQATEWGVLALAMLATYPMAVMYDAPAIPWAQALTGGIAVSGIVAAVLCALKALHHARRHRQMRV